jgi:pSer/pThr/pTyr-binding forkhead associated (FHA) protein
VPKISVYRGRTHLFDHWIEKPTVVIGRSSEAEIPLDSPAASRKHCRIVRRKGGYTLEELGAKNGLFVNGQYCNVWQLKDRDQIEIADHILVFHRSKKEQLQERQAQQGGNAAAYRLGAAEIDKSMNAGKNRSGEVRKGLKGESVAMTMAVSPDDLEKLLAEAKKKNKAHLEIVGENERVRVELDKTKQVLGFTEGVEILLPFKRIWPWGQRSAEIQALPGSQFKIVRLSKWVTIKVNGSKLLRDQVLHDKDKISIGGVGMRYLAATELGGKKKRR